MIIETSRKAEHIEWFLTDVLLFTHLVHLPAAYASKTVLWIYALRSFNDISLRLGSFETVRRTFEVIWCVIAAVGRYGIGRDDDESKLA